MTLNVHRALEAIGKFHMNHPLDNNAGFLKINNSNGSGEKSKVEEN